MIIYLGMNRKCMYKKITHTKKNGILEHQSEACNWINSPISLPLTLFKATLLSGPLPSSRAVSLLLSAFYIHAFLAYPTVCRWKQWVRSGNAKYICLSKTCTKVVAAPPIEGKFKISHAGLGGNVTLRSSSLSLHSWLQSDIGETRSCARLQLDRC